MTASIRPYSIASSGVMNRSRSMSRITCSTSRPEWREMISAIRRVMLEDLARRDLDVGRGAAEAARALVDHDLRVREREPLPGAPPQRIIAAADMPIPRQTVATSGFTYCIAS